MPEFDEFVSYFNTLWEGGGYFLCLCQYLEEPAKDEDQLKGWFFNKTRAVYVLSQSSVQTTQAAAISSSAELSDEKPQQQVQPNPDSIYHAMLVVYHAFVQAVQSRYANRLDCDASAQNASKGISGEVLSDFFQVYGMRAGEIRSRVRIVFEENTSDSVYGAPMLMKLPAGFHTDIDFNQQVNLFSVRRLRSFQALPQVPAPDSSEAAVSHPRADDPRVSREGLRQALFRRPAYKDKRRGSGSRIRRFR